MKLPGLLNFVLRNALTLSVGTIFCAQISIPAEAQSFTVVNGQTVTTQQDVGTGGTGTIETTGTIQITTAGEHGVAAAVDGVLVNNYGTITYTTLGGFNGINVLSGNTINNFGTITAPNFAIMVIDNNVVLNTGTLNAFIGIFGNNNNTVTNSGTLNVDCCGINLFNDNVVLNSGTIDSDGNGIVVLNTNQVTNSGMIDAFGYGISSVDGNTITNSGTITAEFDGVIGDGIHGHDDNTIINSGTINADIDGISADDRNTITNSGTIDAEVDGIYVDDDNTITNHGTILADSDGISFEDYNVIINTGRIEASVDGIYSEGEQNTITNSGTIIAIDDGIDVLDRNTIINRGTIISVDDDGVELDGVDNILINSGSIFGDDAGVEVEDGGNTIFNSGTVANSNGPGSLAFDFFTGANRLVFVDSPLTIGEIQFQDGGSDDTAEFQVAGGRSLDVTFDPLPGILVFDASRQSTVVDTANNRVIYIDPTGFASDQLWLNSLTSAVFAGIESASNRTGATNTGNNLTSTFFLQHAEDAPSDPALQDPQPNHIWASSFAGAATQNQSGTTGDTELAYGGVMMGADAYLSNDMKLGLFAGFQAGRVDGQSDSHEVTSQAGFAGIYANKAFDDYWASFVAFAGVSDNDSERQVANNLVAGGLETASANYGGAFISPALTVGKNLGELESGQPVLGSLRIHYAGLFLDGHSETGVANPLTVSDREVHTLGSRMQLSMPGQMSGSDGTTIHYRPRIGVDYQFSPQSQRVDASVAGLPLNFTAQFDEHDPGGFVGATFSRFSDDGRQVLEASAEARIAIDGSSDLRGQISFKQAF